MGSKVEAKVATYSWERMNTHFDTLLVEQQVMG